MFRKRSLAQQTPALAPRSGEAAEGGREGLSVGRQIIDKGELWSTKKYICNLLIGFHLFVGMNVVFNVEADALQTKKIGRRNFNYSLRVDGLDRKYVVHVPKRYKRKQKVPVVIMFHGGGGTARATMRETKWNVKSEEEGFLMVYPEGTRSHPNRRASFSRNPQNWNDGSGRMNVGAIQRGVDDVKFVRKIIEDLSERYNIDKKRVYVTGFSNGAGMAFRVARVLSDMVAANAAVSGSDWLEEPIPSRPVPLLYISGTDDRQNPLEGGEITLAGGHYGRKPSVYDQIEKWSKMFDCPINPQIISDEDGVKGISYGPCRDDSKIVFYTIEGMGHTWPGGKSLLPESIVGKTSNKIIANDLIWEFFKSCSR
ncbi:hypothetical protein BVX98_00665 [bacterium F11]|nr:hypothetical protein BVX98_00665 [bacterium F11]